MQLPAAMNRLHAVKRKHLAATQVLKPTAMPRTAMPMPAVAAKKALLAARPELLAAVNPMAVKRIGAGLMLGPILLCIVRLRLLQIFRPQIFLR
jgi:hypothetical protein